MSIISICYGLFRVGIVNALYRSNTNLMEDSQMKKVLSTIVAAIVALSFSAVVFAADMPAGHPATAGAEAAAPAAEKKEVKKAKKAKKAKKVKKEEKKEEAPAAPAAK
jgi:predicted TIM-barrel fold metal-dependent hydrolase